MEQGVSKGREADEEDCGADQDRAGRPALEVVDPAAVHDPGADTLQALAATAEAAARIAADQASQDEANARAAAEAADAIADAGRRRREAADQDAAAAAATDDSDDWDRASMAAREDTDAAVVDDGYGNDARYQQRYDTDRRYTAPDDTSQHTAENLDSAGSQL